MRGPEAPPSLPSRLLASAAAACQRAAARQLQAVLVGNGSCFVEFLSREVQLVLDGAGR